ncbi:MAG: GTP-binding protein [Anaerolineae bacterium]|nr:GTP-binding protein [Anaerolineae bacterium]
MNQDELLKLIDQAAWEGWTELDLSNEGLTELPPEIGRLTTLRSLNLSGNQLTALPPQIVRLVTLRSLYLGGNRLTALLPEISQLTTLQLLALSDNQLKLLPPEIDQLTTLLSLNLRDNHLTALPPEIGWLAALRELELNNNQLTTIPPEIGRLTALKFIDLGSNRLTALPAEIGKLTALKWLDLCNNPDFPLPPEILRNYKDAQAIIRAWLDYLAGQKRPLNEVKLVLVGEGSVGKTSLVNRLLYDTFDPGENKTEGIAIHKWQIANGESANERISETVTGNEQPASSLQVNVWDFGGQEIMHATHQFFLTKRTLYVLVLDSRYSEAENRLDYWLTLIRSFGGDSPILVIGNKTDQHLLDLDRRGLLAKHPTVQAILDTSCATGSGVADLRSAIAKQISLMPHVADPLVMTWFNVKAELETLDEDYIPYSRYLELCREKNVDHPDSQRVLLGFLHDLGVVLHFPDPRLETTNILNPEWVTQGVYRILNTRLPFEEQGILTWEMLAQILDDEPYQEKRMFIVDMMQKFELCYELPDRPHTYLIPDLLPKEEQDTGVWDTTQRGPALRFEVHYPVLPGSILTRLIVRMHRHIQGRVVWRTGVLLACDGNEALVKADLTANRITIAVRGPIYGRHELLTRIREHLGGIHSSLAGLEAAEKVPVPGHPKIPPVDYKWLRELERKGVPEFYPPGLTEPVNVQHLLEGVEVRGGRGSGLSGGALAQLRETLLRCGPLDSDAALRTLFTDARLYPWRDRIPDSTRTREARVDALIDALLEQRTSRGENALSLLLHILAEKVDPGDACHHDLRVLAVALER